MAATGGGADGDLDPRVEAVPAWLFWGLTVVGLALLGFGVYGVWVHRGTGALNTRLRPLLTWGIGAIVAHDLVFAPLALVVGRGLRGVRPRLLRAPVQAGLAVTALLTLLAWPLVRGYGVRASDPSRLPLNYTVGYVAVLVTVWLGCAVWAWLRARAARRAPPPA